MDLISEFIARYQKEFDYYNQAAALAAQQLESSLQSAGIRCIVTYRAKAVSKLEAKCRKREQDTPYGSIDDIYADIVDLAGARVALYFPGDRDLAGKIVERDFNLLRAPKVFPDQSSQIEGKRFSGYAATHYRVKLSETSLGDADKRYAEAPIEIQVASVLMHAWSEVEHDLVYKPLEGKLSEDEYATLDELNGLVLAGEIALERLQRAGERRVSEAERKFRNHYEVAAYLLSRPNIVSRGVVNESDLGRIDLLHSLMSRCQIDTPTLIDPYLVSLDSDFEQRPVSEQIIDRILAEDSNRYRVYEAIREEAHAVAVSIDQHRDEYDQEVGQFIRTWVRFETLIRDLVPEQNQFRSPVVGARALARIGGLDQDVESDLNRVRRLRNNLVHGVEAPQIDDLRDATARLKEILAALEAMG